jgi:uncharacterized cupin superfamily protein
MSTLFPAVFPAGNGRGWQYLTISSFIATPGRRSLWTHRGRAQRSRVTFTPCHFLEGRCILTPEGGKPIELKAAMCS